MSYASEKLVANFKAPFNQIQEHPHGCTPIGIQPVVTATSDTLIPLRVAWILRAEPMVILHTGRPRDRYYW